MQRFAMLPVRRQLAAAIAGVVMLALVTVAVAPSEEGEGFLVAALLYQLVVVAAAVFGGLVVALAAATAAGLLLNYFFADPVHTVQVTDGAHAVAIVVFLAVGAIVSLVVGQSEARLALAQQTTAAESRAVAAQDADRMKTALLAAVGHDLRTPLAAASAAATSLASEDVVWTTEQRAELLASTIGALERLERLIDDLLDTSRLDAGVLPVSLEAMRVEDAVALALDEFGDAGDAVSVSIAPELPDARADPVLVQRVVVNVVGNSLRHAGGAVEMRIGVAGPVQGAGSEGASPRPAVELAVVDHGPGIPPESLEDAFRPFRRLDDRGTGVGLGLALSRGFAEAMGGALSIGPTPGGGLTCVLALPVSDAVTRLAGEGEG
ncbi:DUF4118 domain-containing protein [Microbacterium betulae]|uniref:histidine kinase n=1 Tax=Microbacterium betulae TaxID=2981139 RepID=A0AA97FM69_9MICO|nr:ATP-binding protein [Microbacterium sp. AB]WOF24579.1 DUF4118 domain-containing protein [Microbacterium sp. AB]